MEVALPFDRSVRNTLGFLQAFLGHLPLGEMAVRLWDGTVWKNSSQPRCILILSHPGALRRMFWHPSREKLKASYLAGDFDVEGNLEDFLVLADCLSDLRWGMLEKWRLARHLLGLPTPVKENVWQNSTRVPPVGSRYFPEGFFRLLLGPDLVACSGHFVDAGESLAGAQKNKLEYLCRKLRLQQGERLLDLNSGWGSLVMHACLQYGVEAHGVNADSEQTETAGRLVGQAGLAGVCRVESTDFADLGMPHCYDKLVRVGMFDAIGESRLPSFFAQAWRLLRPGGVFLLQGIASSLSPSPANSSSSPPDPHLFAEGTPPSITELLRIAELTGFEIRDLENLREHGTLTLRHWISRLESMRETAVDLIGERDFRAWHLGLAVAAHAFRSGVLSNYQLLLLKPEYGESHLPLSRADWYGAG